MSFITSKPKRFDNRKCPKPKLEAFISLYNCQQEGKKSSRKAQKAYRQIFTSDDQMTETGRNACLMNGIAPEDVEQKSLQDF